MAAAADHHDLRLELTNAVKSAGRNTGLSGPIGDRSA